VLYHDGLGIDIPKVEQSGQLEVRGWEDAHLRQGWFDQGHRGVEHLVKYCTRLNEVAPQDDATFYVPPFQST
jgi:hypothetical protein